MNANTTGYVGEGDLLPISHVWQGLCKFPAKSMRGYTLIVIIAHEIGIDVVELHALNDAVYNFDALYHNKTY